MVELFHDARMLSWYHLEFSVKRSLATCFFSFLSDAAMYDQVVFHAKQQAIKTEMHNTKTPWIHWFGIARNLIVGFILKRSFTLYWSCIMQHIFLIKLL